VMQIRAMLSKIWAVRGSAERQVGHASAEVISTPIEWNDHRGLDRCHDTFLIYPLLLQSFFAVSHRIRMNNAMTNTLQS